MTKKEFFVAITTAETITKEMRAFAESAIEQMERGANKRKVKNAEK